MGIVRHTAFRNGLPVEDQRVLRYSCALQLNAKRVQSVFWELRPMIDLPALLAIAALGWGLSLCTYRTVARRNGWPLGALHTDLPAVAAIIGLVAIFVALAFASWRGTPEGGWIVILFGVLLAFFWTGFLRVGSQVTLFLAPIATASLIFMWLALGPGFERTEWLAPALAWALV